MKKKAYIKNQIRIIKKTKARFLSIFAIIFLGASFFAGLRSTPLIMKTSMNNYLQTYNYQDLNYIGTLGLDKDIINKVSKVNGVKSVEYGLRFDALMKHGDDSVKGVTVFTNDNFDNDVARQELVSGKFPTKDNQCVLDEYFSNHHNYKIGDKITLDNDNGSKEYTVTATVNDTRYFCDFERGTNTLGDGTNNAFIMVLTKGNESLALPQKLYDLYDDKIIYNDLRVTLDNPDNLNVFNDDYLDYIKPINKQIKKIIKNHYTSLYNQWIDDASSALASGTQEYNEGLSQYNDGLNQYNEGKSQYESGLKQYNEGLTKYNSGYQQYKSGLSKYNQGLEDYQNGLVQYNTGIKAIQDYDNIVNQLNQLNEALKQYPDNQTLKAQRDMVQAAVDEYVKSFGSIEQIEKSRNELSQSKIKLDSAKMQLDVSKKTLDETAITLNSSKQLLNSTKVKLDQAKQELDNNQPTLDQAKTKLDEAKAKLDEANDQIKKITKGKVVSLTRQENAAVLSYIGDCESIDSLSILFPTIFFLVAALVSLTTMTRMVEEQRVQSGTLRALGYNKQDVVMQYLIYAFLATFGACGLGVVFGTYFFPSIIYYLYRAMMFDVGAPTKIVFDLMVVLQTFAISVAITMLVTFIVCISELSNMPASLLRPKAPKLGKRIIIERIGFVWRRLSFNQKVTMRNIFRYKKRFFMSIAGIAGCTALIVVAFGIRESITPLAGEQYGKMWTYDGVVNYQDGSNQETRDEFLSQSNVKETLGIYNKTVSTGNQYATIEIPQDTNMFDNFIHLTSFEDGKELMLNNDGVMINAKLAELLELKTGDTMIITLDNDDYKVKVAGVYKLYFRHYIYMTNDYYQKITGKDVTYNSQYFSLKKDNDINEKKLSKYVDSNNQIASISYVSGIAESFLSQMSSLSSVVFILIFCAGALAFIVIYNLTNINIQERKSEIATIKVLGFYPKEVYDYVFRENIILSFIGSLVGLVVGTLIHGYLIRNVEVDLSMFIRTTNYKAYIPAFLFTMAFTYLIDLYMRRVLKQIDMVESLKSIE